MFSVYELKTGVTRTVDKDILLIMLRRFEDGYEQWFYCLSLTDTYVASDSDGTPVFIIDRTVRQ